MATDGPPNEKSTKLSASHEEGAAPPATAGWAADLDDAKNASNAEHTIPLMEAFRTYPKAILWSVAISLGIVMEGYDTSLVGSLYAQPAFQKQYGNPYDGGYQLSASWQVALGLSSTIGIIFGIFMNGYLTEKFGFKKVLLVSYVLVTAFITIPFTAQTVQILFGGEVLCGVPWGVFATLGPAYASEVLPTKIRGYLQIYVNLCWVIGQFVAAGVLDGLVNNTTQWAYRIPFAVQWVWPLPLFCLVLFAPESPWWLVRKGRLEDAERSLHRLSNSSTSEIRKTIAMMVHTNELENTYDTGISFWDCFKGVERRRTEISCLLMANGTFAGIAISSQSTYFFTQAGVAASDAYKLAVGQTALAFVGTALSWFTTSYFGRRVIYLYGYCVMTTIMFIIGFLSLAPDTNIGAQWGTSVLLLIWTFLYDDTSQAIAYAIVGEVSSTRLRTKTICLARNFYNVANIVVFISGPYIENPTAGNWKGKAGFLAGGLSLLVWIWAYFRLPETKGRTYEEIDILFQKRIPARKFKGYQVDAYDDETALTANEKMKH